MQEQASKRQRTSGKSSSISSDTNTQSSATSPAPSEAPAAAHSLRSRSSKLAGVPSTPGKPTKDQTQRKQSTSQSVQSIIEDSEDNESDDPKPLMQLKSPAGPNIYHGEDNLFFTIVMKVFRFENCFVIKTRESQCSEYLLAIIEEQLLGDMKQKYRAKDIQMASLPNATTIVPVFALNEISVSDPSPRHDVIDGFCLLSTGFSTPFHVVKSVYEKKRNEKLYFNCLTKVHSINKSLVNLMDIHGNLIQVLMNLPPSYSHLTPTQGQLLFWPMMPYQNSAIKFTTPDFVDVSKDVFIDVHALFAEKSSGIMNASYNIRDIVEANGFSGEPISIAHLNTLRVDWPANQTKRFVLNSVNLDPAALADLQNFEQKDCSYVGCHKCSKTAFGVTEAGVTIDFCGKCKKETVSGRILRPSFKINDDEGNEIVMSVFANHIVDILKVWDSYHEFKSLINSYSDYDFKDKFLGWLTSVSTEDFFKHFTEDFVYNFVAVNKFDLEVSVKSANGTAFVSITRVRKSV